MMKTSRSRHYYKSKGNKKRDAILLEKIRAIATEFPCYGYRRVTAQVYITNGRVENWRAPELFQYVSSSRHIKPSVRISRTGLSC